ncbi:hypothetical protein Bca52824_043963 [Brassica carinata]|uniref:Uncharacterized protein n=1 Tax=Brassica carinata TaxID=52824 RepID=A0A8X7S4C8_BRACI|nr:hypothetical protein Bca52824_043963 [Brassica carinata]
MSCLALALQPVNGSDILLQTREWFPPARALIALSYFRQTRQAFSSSKQQQQPSNRKHTQPSSSSAADPDDAAAAEFVGDDPRCFERTSDRRRGEQAVSVIVTACRGVDVTPEKLGRKYAEVYMALDIVLRGVSNIRLAAMLGAMHGDGIAKMVHSALDTENKIRGADSWMAVESHAAEHQAAETEQLKEEPEVENKDPFAASETINKEKELVGGFKKTKDPSSQDLSLALAGLEVTTLPPAEATQSTHINVEGFEGEYGGIAFSNEQATIGETLNRLVMLGRWAVEGKDGEGGNLDNLVKKAEMKGPEMYVSEEIRTEFRESLLARVGLMGVIYLKTMPPKGSGEEKETEFSFRVEGTAAVKRFAMQSSRISSLGDGLFHVRTAPSEEPIPILNPDLPEPLKDVDFILKLPVDPTLLKVSPKAILNRTDRELKWQVPEIPLNGSPGRLRARMPIDSDNSEEEPEIICFVKFSVQGKNSLSGISLRPAAEGCDLAVAVDGVDFNLMEKYQAQLAMANSLSDPDPTENADTAQLDAVKRISLGVVKAPVTDADSAVDFCLLAIGQNGYLEYSRTPGLLFWTVKKDVLAACPTQHEYCLGVTMERALYSKVTAISTV